LNLFWFLQPGMTIDLILLGFLVRLFIIFAILPVHEFAHAFVSHKLGDDTAKWMGRMTLDPVKHLDPIGALMIMFVGFGWAKPVPVNPKNYKNERVGSAIVSAAGPLSNLIFAFLAMFIYKVLIIAFGTSYDFFVAVSFVFSLLVSINISLAIFNLIPIPPLDGFDILALFLPRRAVGYIEANRRIISYALMAFIVFGSFTFIEPVSDGIWGLFNFLTRLILGI